MLFENSFFLKIGKNLMTYTEDAVMRQAREFNGKICRIAHLCIGYDFF